MNWITIGLIAQTLGTALLLLGYAPQIAKLHRTKNPTGISLLFWTMIAVGCTTILVNMNISDAPFEVQLTQGFNALGAWYTLFLVIYCRLKRGEKIKVNPIALTIFGLAIGFIYIYSLNVSIVQVGLAFQTLGTIALLTAYLPQIFYLYKVKDATGISKWLFIILALGLLLVTINMIITKTSVEIIVTEFINIALIIVQYIMTDFYQRNIKQNY